MLHKFNKMLNPIILTEGGRVTMIDVQAVVKVHHKSDLNNDIAADSVFRTLRLADVS